jgi:hypothetical protein
MSTNEQGSDEESSSNLRQDGCVRDADQKALQEIEKAERHIAKAGADMTKAAGEVEVAEHELEKAVHDLDEARHDRGIIHFSVDGEPYETRQREWTPNAIIKDFGGRDPATNYLVEIEGLKKISYQGKGEIPIKLHECEQFQIISTGPTPVSDGATLTGVGAFVIGLQGLGCRPTALGSKANHVVFDYTVMTGSHAGKQVRLGFIVPPDFPLTAPTGPHVSPRIHAFQSGGNHPIGGILKSPDFEAGAGGEWQYWSRPFNEWGATKKSVATYLSHVWQLWDSQ